MSSRGLWQALPGSVSSPSVCSMDPLFILRTYLRIAFGSTSPVSFQSTWFKVSILFASEAVWSRYLSAFGLFVVGLVCFQISRVVWLQTVGLIFSFCSHLEGVLAAVSACLGFPGHFDFFPYGLCLLILLRYQFLRLSMVSLATESADDEWQFFPTTQRCGVARRLPTVYNHPPGKHSIPESERA